jgi:hypothetical protein
MAIKRQVFLTVISAAADLRALQYHAVTATGVVTDAATAQSALTAAGVVANKPNSGEFIELEYFGEVKGYCFGTIPNSAFVHVESGMFAACGSGDLRIGRALEACTSGSVHRLLVNFITPVVTINSFGGN